LSSVVNLSEIESYLEIGGNPTPIITAPMSEFPNKVFYSVEPYISTNSESLFQDASNNGLVITKTIFDIDLDFNIIFFLGIDLSLVKSYEDLRGTILKIRTLISKANYVILEHGDFAPSRWLVELLSEDMHLINMKDWKFEDNLDISLDGFTLNRRLYVFKPKALIHEEISNSQTVLQNKYSSYFDIDNSPIPDYPYRLPLTGDAYTTNKIFNSWPVEKNISSNEEFVWLRPNQRIKFPLLRKTLVLEFYSICQTPISQSIFFKLRIDGNFLTIKRRFLGRFWNRLTFPHFIPCELDLNSTDNRKLSIAVKNFEYK
jgi:hypothetical protein